MITNTAGAECHYEEKLPINPLSTSESNAILRIALIMLFALALLTTSGMCQSNKSADSNFNAKSREAFFGIWKGTYFGIEDTMKIEAGTGPKSVIITMHAREIPDKVKGILESPTRIRVPEQSMGGYPGTAIITLDDGKLTLRQKMSGKDGVVEGKGYQKQAEEKERKVEAVLVVDGMRVTAVGTVSTYPFWDGRKNVTANECAVTVTLVGKEAQEAYSMGPVEGSGITSKSKKLKIDN